MSMLAERKRKIKWGVNPQGNLWSNDNTKFGQKLLEKMGWSPGEGLGVQKQGRSNVLRVQYKNDSKGFGFKGNDEDWVKHQDEFNAFLTNLSEQAETYEEIDPIKVDNGTSLELKSSKSRARIHYHKFTRGKDLSRYSNKDLTAILGTSVKVQDLEKQHDSNKNHINAGSMDEYFKRKLSLSNIKNFGNDYTIHNNRIESEQDEEITIESSDNTVKKKKKSKKLKLDKINVEEDVVIEERGNVENNKVSENVLDQNVDFNSGKKKFKYNNKKDSCPNAMNEEIDISEEHVNENLGSSENSAPKKRKKSKQMKMYKHDFEDTQDVMHDTLVENSESTFSKRKRKKTKVDVPEFHENITDKISEQPSNITNLVNCKDNELNYTAKTKNKKKRSRHQKIEGNTQDIEIEYLQQTNENIISQSSDDPVGKLEENIEEDSIHISVKKKKKKKVKNMCNDVSESDEIKSTIHENVDANSNNIENAADCNDVENKNVQENIDSGIKKKKKSKVKSRTPHNDALNFTQLEEEKEITLENKTNQSIIEDTLKNEDASIKKIKKGKKRKLDIEHASEEDELNRNKMNKDHKQNNSYEDENCMNVDNSKINGQREHDNEVGSLTNGHRNSDSVININGQKANLSKYSVLEENDFQNKNGQKLTDMAVVKNYFKRNKLVLSAPELNFKGSNINEIEGYGFTRKNI